MTFQSLPSEFRARPLYWLNALLSKDELRAQLTAMREHRGFGGLAPLVLKSARPECLNEEYFEDYGFILDTAKELGLKVIFYDHISFPSGTAGGRVAEKFPDSVIENLRKAERAVSAGTALAGSSGENPFGKSSRRMAFSRTSNAKASIARLRLISSIDGLARRRSILSANAAIAVHRWMRLSV